MKFGDEPDDSYRFHLPCNGVLKIIIEKIQDPEHFRLLIEGISTKTMLVRKLDIASGAVEWCLHENYHLQFTNVPVNQ